MSELPENPHKCTGFCKAPPNMLFSYGLREEDRRYHAWEEREKHYAGYLSPEEHRKLKSQLAAANTTIEGLTLANAEAVKAERERIKAELGRMMNFDPGNWKGPIYEISQDMWNHCWQELEE